MVMPGHGEREMKPVMIFRRCMEVLSDGYICALATTLESKPRVRAMEYAVDDAGIIYMLTEGGRKVRDILLNPNVSIAVWEDGSRASLVGLSITARAEIVDPGAEDRFAQYYENYKTCSGKELPPVEELPQGIKIIRVVPDVMELFDPSLSKEGYSPRQIWRR